MDMNKRKTLKRGTALAAGIGAFAFWPRQGFAQQMDLMGDAYPTEEGQIIVHPVNHASLAMMTAGKIVYVDPVGSADLYKDLPAPDLILVTHEHGDHFSNETLEALIRPETVLITNPAVFGKLSDPLKPIATQMANGDTMNWETIAIDAVPAYNLTEDRLKYHPKGRDNGYVLGFESARVYIAGDTENIPEMADLGKIDVAFLPMNLPYTMSVDQAAEAVKSFGPANVYPYHYRGSDIDTFEKLVNQMVPQTKVVRHDWYA